MLTFIVWKNKIKFRKIFENEFWIFTISGIEYRIIFNQLSVPISLVGTIVRHWKTHNSTLPLISSGRPRKISERAQRLLIRKVKEAPKITLNELQTDLKHSGVNVSS